MTSEAEVMSSPRERHERERRGQGHASGAPALQEGQQGGAPGLRAVRFALVTASPANIYLCVHQGTPAESREVCAPQWVTVGETHLGGSCL